MESTSGAFVTTFPSSLGWFALAVRDEQVVALTYGRRTQQLARSSVANFGYDEPIEDPFVQHLIDRLQAYSEGADDDFLDVELNESSLTRFAKRVIRHCRRIPLGNTLTYGQLAAKAGSPHAARAVGNVMKSNRFPIIVPCHRVVGAGSLGGYSAPDGLKMKRRLLNLEGCLC